MDTVVIVAVATVTALVAAAGAFVVLLVPLKVEVGSKYRKYYQALSYFIRASSYWLLLL